MSFRHKLLASFTGLLALVLGATLWTVNRVETRRTEADILTGLSSTNETFEGLLASRERQLQTSLGLLSGDFAFKQAVATGDPATILSAALNHKARIGADVLVVTDSDGKLLADTRRTARVGRPLAGVAVVKRALEGSPAAEIAALDEIGRAHV